MRPRAAYIDVGSLFSINVGHHKLADHASMMVEEDVAVEEPAAQETAERCAINEHAIVKLNSECKRVIGRHIDAVPELAITPRKSWVACPCERNWLHRETVQMEGMMRVARIRDRQLESTASFCVTS